jgi:hypothetical protein
MRLLAFATILQLGLIATPALSATINNATGPQFGDFTPGKGGDVFSIDAGSFGVTDPLSFQSGFFGNPGISDIGADDPDAIASDVNVVVIQNFDNNDLNSLAPATWDASWNARTALRAIAANTTGDRAGFFLYWNEGLGVNRLFAAENLNDGESLFQLLFTDVSETLTGVPGDFDLNLSDGFAQIDLFGEANANLFELADYSAENFEFSDQISAVPLPATLPILLAGIGVLGWTARRKA